MLYVYIEKLLIGSNFNQDIYDQIMDLNQTFVSHLSCSLTGEKYDASEIHNLSKVGKPLLVNYYLDQIIASYNECFDDLQKNAFI